MTSAARQKNLIVSVGAVAGGKNQPTGRPRRPTTSLVTRAPWVADLMVADLAVVPDDPAADVVVGGHSGETFGPRSCCCWPTSRCTAIS